MSVDRSTQRGNRCARLILMTVTRLQTAVEGCLSERTSLRPAEHMFTMGLVVHYGGLVCCRAPALSKLSRRSPRRHGARPLTSSSAERGMRNSRGLELNGGTGGAHASSTPGARALSDEPAKEPAEVRLVGQTAIERDLTQRCNRRQHQALRPLHPPVVDVLEGRASETLAKGTTEMA